jgi:hypothetical protein
MMKHVPVRARRGIHIVVAALGLGTLLTAIDAQAVPAFARQTGENCIACHISFPELTPFGRFFKLRGYTLGKRQPIPLSGMLQASYTSTRDTTNSGPDTFIFDKNDEIALQAASAFLAGKFTDHFGVFNQWTYDGIGHHLSIDNTDLRLTDTVENEKTDLIYGLTVHNNPTVQDVWNTTPAFGFPYASSSVANTPAASTLIDGGLGSQVMGVGGYVFWNKTLYGELTAYRTADKQFDIFRQGTDTTADAVLHGYNPYWRLALSHEWGPHSAMVGTYGMVVDVFPDPTAPTGPTDRYRDYAFDAQYQYITDPHTFTAQLNWIHEKTDWNASFPLGGVDNPSSTLKTAKAKASYYYQRKYGATLAYFSTTGDVDNARFNNGTPIIGSANGSPDSRGFIYELDYVPIQNIKLSLQYTAYRKFNGAGTNYDGAGRNAGDNNTFYLLGWFMF